jgi:hypothetical protein
MPNFDVARKPPNTSQGLSYNKFAKISKSHLTLSSYLVLLCTCAGTTKSTKSEPRLSQLQWPSLQLRTDLVRQLSRQTRSLRPTANRHSNVLPLNRRSRTPSFARIAVFNTSQFLLSILTIQAVDSAEAAPNCVANRSIKLRSL